MNQTIKRLIIFLSLSCLPIIIMMALVSHFVTPNIYAVSADANNSKAEYYASVVYAVGVFGMLCPSIAHVLTRLLTKEGFRNLLLWGAWKGKRKYYICSVLVPLAIAFFEVIIFWRVYAPGFGIKDIFYNSSGIPLLLLQLAVTIILVIPAFGEEWGWRGYMMPKLTELLGKPLAIVVGGIIWGLWHAPLTIHGHNFGVGYPGYPYVGILAMCLFCICQNAFLTLLTEKTGAIYAASVAHMTNNNLGMGIFLAAFARSEVLDCMGNVGSMKVFFILLPLTLVQGVISFVLLMKKSEK